MVIKILSAQEEVKASGDGQLLYAAEYEDGDIIVIEGRGHAVISVDETLPPSLGFFAGEYRLPIPFGEKKLCYNPKSFTGNRHFLWARPAHTYEVAAYRNLALNPADNPHNSDFFPHASANIETRGESVFFARNAIDGVCASGGHGEYPYQSWGINRREDAELTIDFGRDVRVDRAVIVLRSDFPHDAWWKQASLAFSDGSVETAKLEKTDEPQIVEFAARTVKWARIHKLIKADDPSPFPALMQIEFWGAEI